jgi:hypothetical protein
MSFLKTLPNQYQTKEAQLAILKNIKKDNSVVHNRSKDLKDILKENKNVPPRDLTVQLSDRSQKRYEDGLQSKQNKSQEYKIGSIIEKLPNPATSQGLRLKGPKGPMHSDGKNWVYENGEIYKD